MNARKNHFLLCLVVLFFFVFSHIKVFAQFEQKVSEKLWITFPKNLTLFHILVILTPSGEKRMNLFGHPLAQTAKNYFQNFKNHPAVQATNKMFKFRWYFVFNYSAFYYSDFPEAKLIEGIDLPPEFERMKKMISQYIDQVRDFYTTSNFGKFWETHRKDFESVIQVCKDNIPVVGLPRMMEEFFGAQAERFYFVPCPFMQSSGTHVEVKGKDRKWTFYYISGGDLFLDSLTNISIAFHEFSHCFIEPISETYSEQISKLKHLYKPLREDLSKRGYRNWDRGFAEHMVRAAELHFIRKAFGEEVKEQRKEMEKRRGFKIIDWFYSYFKEYDENRDKYKKLATFYPEILKRLSRLKIEEYRRPTNMGFYPEFKENRYFIKDIVPDSAFDKAGIQKGDILFSIEKDEVISEESFNKAKEKWWNRAKEGDSVKIVVIREGNKIEIHVPVPFITDHRYVED